MREGPLARACVSTRSFLQPLGPFVLSCLYIRDDSLNSACLTVLVCGLEAAELLRCHAVAWHVQGTCYGMARWELFLCRDGGSSSCTRAHNFLLMIWSVSHFSVSFGINWGAWLKCTVEAWLLNLK